MIHFTKLQYEFLQKEFGMDPQKADQMTEDELFQLADACFDIELEGDLGDGSQMPDRCGIAASIVDAVNQE